MFVLLYWLYDIHNMVLISDGNSKISVQVVSKIGNLIWLRHLVRSRVDTNLILFSRKRLVLLHTCAKVSELPSNMSTMIKPSK